jgi:hypothetical protein
MREFFHGWRRKVGIVTLAMACMVMGAWIRSLSHGDTFGYVNQPALPIWLLSVDGTLVIVTEIPIEWGKFDWSFKMWRTEPFRPLEEYLPDDAEWSFNWCRLAYGKGLYRLICIPYWSIAVPLTLLSAYLILWKPRKRPGSVPKR